MNPMKPVKAATKAESSLSGSISLAKAQAKNTEIPALNPEYRAGRTSFPEANWKPAVTKKNNRVTTVIALFVG